MSCAEGLRTGINESMDIVTGSTPIGTCHRLKGRR
jgi:hypothetical protein